MIQIEHRKDLQKNDTDMGMRVSSQKTPILCLNLFGKIG